MAETIEDENPGVISNRSENLSQVAYDTLLSQIMNRTLVGGSVIQERKMAGALGISRTPMRKALARFGG